MWRFVTRVEPELRAAAVAIFAALLIAVACTSDVSEPPSATPADYSVVGKEIDASGTRPVYHIEVVLDGQRHVIETFSSQCYAVARLGEVLPAETTYKETTLGILGRTVERTVKCR